MKKVNKQDGFTLIEVLVVIGIIALLASIVIVAINPAKQFAQARNTQRHANVTAILNAVGQRLVDNKGVFAGTFKIGNDTFTCGLVPDDAPTAITDGMAPSPSVESSALKCLVPTYISSLPSEPKEGGAQYTIQYLAGGRIRVCAPESANEDSLPDEDEICVTR